MSFSMAAKHRIEIDSESKPKRGKKRKRERTKQPRVDYEVIEKENKSFEEFYTKQGIISHTEWEHFMTTVREPLPATFRLTSNSRVSSDLLECLTQRYIRNFPKFSIKKEPITPPTPIPWYPHGLAWHVDITKKDIRNDPVLAGYHAFLMRETEIGHICRQEAVSMIPPLFLDIQAHHKVLDMCAAPGSKTAQIIEALHQSHCDLPPELRTPFPPGLVVANDSDNKRSYLLVHQAKRMKSANVLVTNHDGTVFPNLFLSEEDRKTGSHVLYDRVLCDVPCSGDGTIRKNPLVWRKWAPFRGNGLHRLQLRLAVRGAELLVEGGRLVYSTCSMNPIEDEAVIHTLLKLSEGALQLVDVSSSLVGLDKRPGLSNWKVMDNEGVWVEEDSGGDKKGGVFSSFFPPPPGAAAHFCLERCLRVYPHHQNTGGFFVAVIHKVAALPWMKDKAKSVKSRDPAAEVDKDSKETDAKSEEGNGYKVENRPFQIFGKFTPSSGFKGFKEDPFILIDRSDPPIAEVSSLYGLPPDFPWENCFTRSEGKAKNNIYITTPLISRLLAANQDKHAVKIINTGLRAFSRSDQSPGSPSRLRITQEGCNLLVRFISERKVHISESDIIKLLDNESISMNDLSDQSLKNITPLPIGPLVFIYHPAADSAESSVSKTEKNVDKKYKSFVTSTLIFSGWRANWSVRVFVSKEEKQHYLVMLGMELESDASLEEKKITRMHRSQAIHAEKDPTPDPPSPSADPLVVSDLPDTLLDESD